MLWEDSIFNQLQAHLLDWTNCYPIRLPSKFNSPKGEAYLFFFVVESIPVCLKQQAIIGQNTVTNGRVGVIGSKV
jgi:hypothetical protein